MASQYLKQSQFLPAWKKKNKPIQEIQIIIMLGKFQNLKVEPRSGLNPLDKAALKSIQIENKEELWQLRLPQRLQGKMKAYL